MGRISKSRKRSRREGGQFREQMQRKNSVGFGEDQIVWPTAQIMR